MKKLEIKQHPILILFLCMTLIMAGMFLPYIIADIPLTYGTDLKPEGYFFTKELYSMLDAFFQNGTLPFYSWSHFLGSDVYSSMSFYGNADIYSLLGYLFKFVNFFFRTMMLEILKLYVSGFGMYALLKQVHFKDKTSIIGALCYAFSGWAIFYSGQSMFLSVFSFLPLYFLGMERYLQKNKYGLFVFSVVLLILTNWYFFYSVSFLSPLYFLYRYAVLHGSLKGSLKPILKLIGIDLIGVMITGVYLLPTITYMEGNDRVFSLSELLIFDNWKIYLHILVSSLVPNHLYIYGNNILDTDQHYTREICMYVGALFALLNIQFFMLKDKRYVKLTKILYSVLIAICLIPFLDSAMHGFGNSSFRWLRIFIIFSIITGCTVLEHRDELNDKHIWITAGIEAVICALVVPVTALISGVSLSDYYHQWIVFIIAGTVIIGYAVILTGKWKQTSSILLCCTVLELFGWNCYFYSDLVYRSDDSDTYLFQYRATHVLQDSDGQFNAYLNSLDEQNSYEYYRVYVPEKTVCWDYSHNMVSAYQVNGLMVYCSTYEPSFNSMKKLVPDVKDFAMFK